MDNPIYRSNYLNVDPWPFESGEVAAGQNQLQGLAERARAWFAPGEAARAGIPGKVLGVLGLDDSGARAATSWGDAAKHSVLSMVGHGFVEGIAGQGQRLMDGSRYATMGGVSRGEDDGMGPAGLMTAAALPMGSAIASRVAPGVARDAPRVYSNPSEASPLAGMIYEGGVEKSKSSYRDTWKASPFNSDANGYVQGVVDSASGDLQIQGSRLSPDLMGKGKGLEMYKNLVDEAHGEGRTVTSDTIVSPEAQRVYDALDRRGYNVWKDPNSLTDKQGAATGLAYSNPVYKITPKPDYLYSNPSEASPLALLQAGRENKGITAYHGSPHDFDRFSMNKIGTGEGAQAYGHGLYFAEKEGVAKQYRDALSDNIKVDGKEPDWKDPGHWMATALHTAKGHRPTAIADIVKNIEGQFPDNRPAMERAIAALESGNVPEKLPPVTGAGHMYEVRINADPEHFLDWDKPLSQQSEHVSRAASSINPAASPSHESNYASVINGSGFHRSLGDNAAQALRDAGIPGIRYLDQGSRTAGEGSRNYVVFNDKIIDIVKKYGIAAAASMYGFSRVNEAMAGGQDAAPQNALAPYSIP